MTPILKLLTVFGLLVLPLGTVSAQGYGGGPGMEGAPSMGGPGMMRGGGMLIDPAGLPALKDKLRITSAQEPQWKAYADAVTEASRTRDAMRQSMQTQPMPQAMTQAERNDQRNAHREAGTAIHSQVQKARDDLSAALDTQQRATLDHEAPSFPNGMMPPR